MNISAVFLKGIKIGSEEEEREEEENGYLFAKGVSDQSDVKTFQPSDLAQD